METITSIILLSCCCVVPFIAILFFVGLFFSALRTKTKFAVPDFITAFINWISIFTIRSITALIAALFFLLIAVSSIEFSLFASMSIFLAVLVAIFITVAIIVKILIHSRMLMFGKKSYVDTKASKLEFTEYEASTIKVDIKTIIPPGYILKITEKMPSKLGGDLRGISTSTKDGKATFEATIPKTRRGVYLIGPVHLTYQDVFGLSQINILDNTRISLTILPQVPQLDRFPLTLSNSKGDKDQEIQAIVNTDDYYATRPYVRGDDVRRLHWKLSAKTDQLVIRQAETTTVSLNTINILIWNIFPRIKLKETNSYTQPTKFKTPAEYGLDNQIRIAAAIIDYALRMGIPINIHYHDKRRLVSYSPVADDPLSWKYKLAEIEYAYDRPDMETLEKLVKNEGSLIVTLSESDVNSATPLVSALDGQNMSSQVFYCPYSYYIDEFASVTQKKESRFMRIIKKILFTKPYFEQTTFGEKLEKLFLQFQERYKAEDVELVAAQERKVITLLKASGMEVKVLDEQPYAMSDNESIIDLIENG